MNHLSMELPTINMKIFPIICISFLLISCGNSEIDKCVEAKLRWDTEKVCVNYKSECLNKESKDKIMSNAKIQHEGDYRIECLRAASGKE
jgi:hypothetical protein